jgi:hypothetical protein
VVFHAWVVLWLGAYNRHRYDCDLRRNGNARQKSSKAKNGLIEVLSRIFLRRLLITICTLEITRFTTDLKIPAPQIRDGMGVSPHF